MGILLFFGGGVVTAVVGTGEGGRVRWTGGGRCVGQGEGTRLCTTIYSGYFEDTNVGINQERGDQRRK